MFDKRTYSSFLSVIKATIALRKWKQADLALVWQKTLRQVEYFFSWARWCYNELNDFRLRFIRNKPNFADRKSDYVVLDWSAIKKNRDSTFKWLTERVYSNKEKSVVNWFNLFWASILTSKWLKYVLNVKLFFSETFLSTTEAWKDFAASVVKKTNAWIFLLDSWYKWAFFCSYIYKVLKRQFLVRIDTNHTMLIDNRKNSLPDWRKKKRWRSPRYPGFLEQKILTMLSGKNAIVFESWKMWIFKNVRLKTWIWELNIPMNIIVFHRNWAYKPIVLVTSVRVEEMKDIEYYHFVDMYYKRWTIETLFKELKSYFNFEWFKTLSLNAIMKFMHIAILCHTLLTMFLDKLHSPWWIGLKLKVQSFLKTTRNIKKWKNHSWELTVCWLKVFLESVFLTFFWTSLTPKKQLIVNNINHLKLWSL